MIVEPKRMAKWIGLALVHPLRGNTSLGESLGACVAVIGEADDARSFFDLVEYELDRMDFGLEQIEDVELLEDRLRHHYLPAEMMAHVDAGATRTGLVFGTFHAYSSLEDDADTSH